MRWQWLLVVVLAGCLSGGDKGAATPDEAQANWAVAALPFGPEHDHTDPRHHDRITTPNFQVVGHDPMISDHYGANAGGYACGDAASTMDGRRIAAVESRSDVGFALVDVTDATAPKWLGELVMERTYIYDLVVVPDGQHIVLVTAAAKNMPGVPPVPPVDPPRLLWRDACGTRQVEGDPLPREAAIVLVDIQDPSAPLIVQHLPLAGYGHSAFAVEDEGRILVLAVTLGPQLERSWAHLYLLADTGPVAQLVPQAMYRSDLSQGVETFQGRVWHDGWIARHPVTGQLLLHLVGGHDYDVLDLADVTRPQRIATWSDRDPDAGVWTGNLHSILPMPELWDGEHYSIIGPEWGDHPEDHPSGIIRVLHTTDPAAPREVAAWTLPVDVEWSGTYMFSNHYYTVWNRTLFASMYHGGIWAVDLSQVQPDEFSLLPTVGVFAPTSTEVTAAKPFRWAPNSQEVFSFEDGTLVTFDSNTGTWTFRYDPSSPMPAPTPWPVRPIA